MICPQFYGLHIGIIGHCPIVICGAFKKPISLPIIEIGSSLNPKDFVFNILKTLCIDLIKSQVKINNIIWVEHYPANTYFFKYDKYAIITFDKTFNEPEWEHISIDELSARTGYDKELFQVNKSLSRKNLII